MSEQSPEKDHTSPTQAALVWQSCYSCRDYAEHRRETLAPLLAAKARREGREVIPVVDEFMMAAHWRHMDGEPLRPDGPTRVTDPVAGRTLATLMMLGSRVSTPPAMDADFRLCEHGSLLTMCSRTHRSTPPSSEQPS